MGIDVFCLGISGIFIAMCAGRTLPAGDRRLLDLSLGIWTMHMGVALWVGLAIAAGGRMIARIYRQLKKPTAKKEHRLDVWG